MRGSIVILNIRIASINTASDCRHAIQHTEIERGKEWMRLDGGRRSQSARECGLGSNIMYKMCMVECDVAMRRTKKL
jgi:hypothetical protein